MGPTLIDAVNGAYEFRGTYGSDEDEPHPVFERYPTLFDDAALDTIRKWTLHTTD